MHGANTLKKQHRVEGIWRWVFMLPAIVLFLAFQGWPIIASGYYSLLDWSGIGDNSKFIGLLNYFNIVKDPYFWNAFWNNYRFTLVVVPVQMVLGLLLAVVLNNGRSRRANSAFRTVYFIPVITTSAIIGIVFGMMFSYSGPITTFLSGLGIVPANLSWLANVSTAFPTTMVIYIWKNVGISMIYWLSALQSIDNELYEAAEIDGCTSWGVFRRITLPLILPTGAVILMMNVISAFRLFDLVLTLTGGGPFFSTDVVSVYVYRYAFSSTMGSPRIGYASAAAMIFGVSTILVALAITGIGKLVLMAVANRGRAK